MQENFLRSALSSESSTTLLMHFDGANGSTQFIAEPSGSTTRVGPVSITTSQSKFGGACLMRTGGDDTSLTVNGNGILPENGDDFTIEFQYRLGAATNIGVSLLTYGSLNIQLRSSVGEIIFYYNSNLAGGSLPFSKTQWNHVAVVMKAGELYSFVNGVMGNFKVAVASYPKADIKFLSRGASAKYPVTDYMDELRISNKAIYHENFTPPTAPFTLDA